MPSAPSVSHIQGYHDDVEEWYTVDPRVNGLVKQQRPHPNRRQNIQDPSVTCSACGTRGHKARLCKKLGFGLFLHKFMTDPRNSKLCKEVADEWAVKNKPREEEAKKIATAYATETGIYYDQLADEFSWDLLQVGSAN